MQFLNHFLYLYFLWRNSPARTRAASFLTFLDHTQHTAVDMTRSTRDRPVAETYTWQHTTLTWDRHPHPPPDSNLQSHKAIGRMHFNIIPLRVISFLTLPCVTGIAHWCDERFNLNTGLWACGDGRPVSHLRLLSSWTLVVWHIKSFLLILLFLICERIGIVL